MLISSRGHMQTKEQLRNAIEQTLPDINKWQNVLEIFVKITGASKGIISLRNRLTAELVVPTDVRQELCSPLVYGFSEEEIYHYITHYIEHDPWTDIENLYHPYEPYPLSKHIARKELENSLFWEWLEPQNISDTVVLEIGASSEYWVAMNLYYPIEDTTVKQCILDYTLEFQKTIQQVWKHGQAVRMAVLESPYIEYSLEQQPQPAFLIRSNRELLAKNKKAEQILKDQNTVFLVSQDKKLRLKNKKISEQIDLAIHSSKEKNFSKSNTKQIEIHYESMILKFTPIGDAENLLGENTAQYMLTIHQCLIWEHPSLTPRQKQLAEILAKGGRVVDFQNHYSITKSTAHLHWGEVKKKFNVKDRAEIHELHMKQ